jgi:Gnt-I system high-affinity gluconate transporter
MAFIILLICILILLALITVFDFSAFIAMLITALCAGLLQGWLLPSGGFAGIDMLAVLKSIEKGMGSTLGSVTIILGLGVMLGHMLAETGAAQRISLTMVNFFGVKNVKFAMVVTGFAVGISMFYNAGFLILIPLVFTIAMQTGLSPVYIGIAMASSLSVTHGFLPPHPGPVAIVNTLGANTGKTLLYGLMAAIPASIIAGLIFPEFVKNIKASTTQTLIKSNNKPEQELPSFGISLLVALFPVVLMGVATACELILDEHHPAMSIIKFFGNPNISILIALLATLVLLGIGKGSSMKTLTDSINGSVGSAALLLLIVGAGGAFKQVLDDGGIKAALAGYFEHTSISPLFLGWLVAFLIRVSLGSATVAGITAAGIVAPIAQSTGASPELMVLAIGAGSLMCSHVNDAGFWLFKEYFGLSIKDTFRTWTTLETIVGTVGLICVLIIDFIQKQFLI